MATADLATSRVLARRWVVRRWVVPRVWALAVSMLAMTAQAAPPTARGKRQRARCVRSRGTSKTRAITFVLRTGERLRVDPSALPPPNVLNRFLRSRGDRRYTLMDPRLVAEAARAARHFGCARVQVISAFRSAAVNARLYRRGHKVALRSRHIYGQALDLRIPGLKIARLCRYFHERRRGGVGCYRRLRFVHIDVGPRRRWEG